MPTTGVSPIFRVVRAAEAFKADLGPHIGRRFTLEGGQELVLDYQHRDALTRRSLSMGTPPVTEGISDLVGSILLGRPLADLCGFIDFLGCDPTDLEQLLGELERLI